MFPVISLLRRQAATQIFVRPDQLEAHDGQYWLRLRRASNSWDFKKASWGLAHDRVPVSEFKVVAPSSEAAAIALVKKENAVAEALRSGETLYTIVLGPEVETTDDGVTTRLVRVAVVRGVFRASGKEVENVPVRGQIGRRFAMPKGVVLSEP